MLVRTILSLAIALLLVACDRRTSQTNRPPANRPRPIPVVAGLVVLPCAETGSLRPHTAGYCLLQRHYVRAGPRAALVETAETLQAQFPGTVVRFMEASWPTGKRPMPPHLSHGDGRQVDLALFYRDREGRPLTRAPTRSGYGAYEPPLKNGSRRCTGATARPAKIAAPDPPKDRAWRLDEVRTAALVRLLAAHPKVRRIFIEPHLKARLGLSSLRKVRFAGCKAARHDDHIHVDFF